MFAWVKRFWKRLFCKHMSETSSPAGTTSNDDGALVVWTKHVCNACGKKRYTQQVELDEAYTV